MITARLPSGSSSRVSSRASTASRSGSARAHSATASAVSGPASRAAASSGWQSLLGQGDSRHSGDRHSWAGRIAPYSAPSLVSRASARWLPSRPPVAAFPAYSLCAVPYPAPLACANPSGKSPTGRPLPIQGTCTS